MSSFRQIANAQEHEGYRTKSEVFSHTADKESSKRMVDGYLKLLKIINFQLAVDNSSIDIGCGAAFITQAFSKKGFNIKGLEYSEDALNIAKEYNQLLTIEQGDMTQFKEDNSYNFIFSREVYLITRVNCFTEQKQTISNIIDSLKENGVFMLVASDVSFPNCMDYKLIMKTIGKEKNIKVNQYYEFIFTKFHKYIHNKVIYKCLEIILLPLIYYKKRNGWASQYIITFEKR